jgi:membrane-associated protein
VISLDRITQGLLDAVAATGPAAPGILLLATFLEHVFPPFPGDLVVLLGAWYVVHGELSWAVAFLSVTAGAVAGAWVDYRIGAAIGRRLDARAAERNPAMAIRLARFEAAYRRFGGWVLVANRFIPGIRAFAFLAAGASGVPLRRVLVLGALSAALWNTALLAAGGLLAENVEDLQRLFARYTRTVAIVIAIAIALGGIVVAVRRRRAARAAAEEP